jgi:hypothetical protein
MNSSISFEDKTGNQYSMSLEEYTRWICLMEAMQFISYTADQKKIDLSKDDKWIKPLELNKYIKARFHSLKHDIGIEENIT